MTQTFSEALSTCHTVNPARAPSQSSAENSAGGTLFNETPLQCKPVGSLSSDICLPYKAKVAWRTNSSKGFILAHGAARRKESLGMKMEGSIWLYSRRKKTTPWKRHRSCYRRKRGSRALEKQMTVGKTFLLRSAAAIARSSL